MDLNNFTPAFWLTFSSLLLFTRKFILGNRRINLEHRANESDERRHKLELEYQDKEDRRHIKSAERKLIIELEHTFRLNKENNRIAIKLADKNGYPQNKNSSSELRKV